MEVSAVLRPNFLPLSASLRSSTCSSNKPICELKLRLFLPVSGLKGRSPFVPNSVLSNESLFNDNRPTEPAEILVERMFLQTQTLDEGLSSEGDHGDPVVNLGTLESDLQAALQALMKKEEDLQDTERLILQELSRLNQAKVELHQREKEIAAGCFRNKKLEDELRQVNLAYASQAKQIEDLKILLKQREQEIAAGQSTLSLTEHEMNKMRDDLIKKSEQIAMMNLELKSKSQLLAQANEVVKKQDIELQELQQAIQEQEEQLKVSESLRKLDVDKINAVQANLERQTMGWLMAHEELRLLLSAEASRHMEGTDKTVDDFRRVTQLLSNVKSELVASQKSLAFSRQQMEQQQQLFEQQVSELEEQKRNVMAYIEVLKDAQVEITSERVKLRAAEANNKEHEMDLSTERELIGELQVELMTETSLLQQAEQGVSCLKEQLEQKNAEFSKMCGLVEHKETALVEAKLEIQKMKSEQASLQLLLEERDLELSNAKKKLEQVSQEISELRMRMASRKDQLMQATASLKEKDEHVQKAQVELNDTKLKVSEAETVIEEIVKLTNMLLISTKDDDSNMPRVENDTTIELLQPVIEKPSELLRSQKKQLETEFTFPKESLRIREVEVRTAERVLTIKDEELKAALKSLVETNEKIKKMKEEMVSEANNLTKLYALAQERIGEKSVGDLAIEKLQLEAAQLQAEAATSSLEKLAEMSHEHLNRSSMTAELDTDRRFLTTDGSNPVTNLAQNNELFAEVKTEIAQLSALSDQLVKDADITLQQNENQNETSFHPEKISEGEMEKEKGPVDRTS